MYKYLKIVSCVFIIGCIGMYQNAGAQSIELLAGNTLNGAVNGAILGGATMALQNSNEIGPVRVGVGLGTLYGIGVGVYDVSKVSAGEQFYISGTFNDGNNTTIIVLLDTFYGAAGGAIVASAVTLVANEPIIDGLQYGSGVGAWVGFGFGLIDAFTLAQRPGSQTSSPSVSDSRIGGLVKYTDQKERLEVGLLNPKVITQKRIHNNWFETGHSIALDVISLNFRF